MKSRVLTSLLIVVLCSVFITLILCDRPLVLAESGSISITADDYLHYLKEKGIDIQTVSTQIQHMNYLSQMINEQIVIVENVDQCVDDTVIQEPKASECYTFFQENKSKYIQKMRTKIDIIETADSLLAFQIAQEAQTTGNFNDLKKKYHIDIQTRHLLENEFIDQDQYGIIGKTASRMNVDEISDPVSLDGHYVIIKTIDRLPERQKKYEECVQKIRMDCKQAMKDSLKNNIIKKYKEEEEITIYENHLKKVFQKHSQKA